MAAFAAGHAAAVDGFECDVRLTADGVPVVIHDETLDRTTDVAGLVRTRTSRELARVDASCRFVPPPGVVAATPQGVPRFADVLAAFPNMRVIVELKDDRPALAEAVVAIVRQTDATPRVCLGSFHRAVLARVRALAPEITTSASLPEARWLLVRAHFRWPGFGTRAFRALQVPPVRGHLRVVSPRFVRQVHREGCVVQVWTVNTTDEAAQFLAMGVDGLISDRPDVTVPARDAFATSQ